MKKIFIILFISFTSIFGVFSQLEKGNFLISFDGNFTKNSSNPVLNNSLINYRYLNLNPSIGLTLPKNFTIGVGVDLSWNKEFFIINTYSSQELKYTSNTYLPYAFFGYYYEPFNRFYIGGQLRLKYGIVQELVTEGSILAASIIPEINYFVSKHVAFYLSLGEVGYSLSMLDDYNKTNWLIDFNPKNWNLGIRVAI